MKKLWLLLAVGLGMLVLKTGPGLLALRALCPIRPCPLCH